MTTPPVLILAYGNPGRGDDALGPMLADRLEAWVAQHKTAGVEVILDFQLNIEHALDLVGRRRVLFIDARASGEVGARIDPVRAQADSSYSTHAVSPQGLLEVHARVIGGRMPQAEILSVRGESFELGAPLTPAASEGLAAAWQVLLAWLDTALAEPEVVDA